MTAQPARTPAPRVPRTIDGIADALTGARRMEFYRAVGQAQAGPDLQHILATWWGQAMLDTDPDRGRIIATVEADTVETVTMTEVIRRRRARGGTVPIPDSGGIVEYAINEADHKVILTRIFPF